MNNSCKASFSLSLKFLLLFILVALQQTAHSQYITLPLNNQVNRAFEDYRNDKWSLHAIKPYVVSVAEYDSMVQHKYFYNYQSNKHIRINPIANIGYAHSTQKSGNAALGFRSDVILGKQFFGNIQFTENVIKYPYYIQQQIDSVGVLPHLGKYYKKDGSVYYKPEITGSLNWKPADYVNVSLGVERNFWGDGYRSLLLSDNASAYPQLKTEFNIWKLKYVIIWASLRDIETHSLSDDYKSKYGVFHYFSLNAAKWLNLSFFESVIWQGEDSTGTRGFELNYLNPVLFFRSTEFALGSPDNAMMGAGAKIAFTPNTFVYSQFILDDFILKEFKANKGWWGNKYGYQVGLKTYNLFTIRHLYGQYEYNKVLPYTYSHVTSLKCYGYQYQPLAHPMGANFDEHIALLQYSHNRFFVSVKNIYTRYGADNDTISYGGDIYKSYKYRLANYGNHLLQGVKTTMNICDVKIAYMIYPKWNMQAYVGARHFYRKSTLNADNDVFFLIGIETLIDNNND